MAAKAIDILTPQQLLDAIARVFAAKGEKVVNDNIQAFDIGQKIAS
jgi:Pyruvate/2-oxoacid:ferredoxin oxidoreductase gamma subunit